MKPYKKRAKGSWCQGKAYKGDGEERQFSKKEIKQQLEEAAEDYLYRHHKGARTRNTKARLEYRVKFYESIALTYKNRSKNDWLSNHFRHSLEEAKKELSEFKLKEKKSS